MNLNRLGQKLPSLSNTGLAVLGAILLVFAFPDFELYFLAWIALVPLMCAVEREKECLTRGVLLGWLFGTVFFFGTCWWLTFAPITYAGFPPVLAYFLLLLVCIAAGIFPAIFGGVMSILLRRFGAIAFLAAPFVWVFTEFLRYWITGNNWNAIGYSQAFSEPLLITAKVGGVLLVGWLCAFVSAAILLICYQRIVRNLLFSLIPLVFWITGVFALNFINNAIKWSHKNDIEANVVALQPNVPMSGLTEDKWRELRQRHIRLAESALSKLNEHGTTNNEQLTTVIFPESPMNFMYEDDAETKAFIDLFAAKHNVNVLFNSAEPDASNRKFFNSAVLVGPEGREVAQYDKIYLLPFGEAVPLPLEGILPGFVGNFSYGREYDLFPFGDSKGGVMICFESHFGQLSREYVRNGADVLIEMTNDGYLGPTPVLRQHLANAVFRAVETNRPILRVTNVGITTFINERGEILDPTNAYQEDTRVWPVTKSDGLQTFYVKYGDWLAWLCTAVVLGLLGYGFVGRRSGSLSV